MPSDAPIPAYRRAIARAYLKYGPAALEKKLRELGELEIPIEARERGLSLLPGADPIHGALDTSAPCGALPPTGEWGQTAGCLPPSCTTGRSS